MAVHRVEDYEVLQGDNDSLGHGGFASVWRGRHVRTGQHVAVKKIRLPDCTPDGLEYIRKYVDNELEALRRIHHGNLIEMYTSKRSGQFMYLFLELCEEGDLDHFLVKKGTISRTMTLTFMQEISDVIKCLHEQHPPLIHRDIKPDNILVKEIAPGKYGIKLTDLGLARRVEERDPLVSMSLCGTPLWMAPEILPNSDGKVHYNSKSDVFSMGMVFYALINHEQGRRLQPLTGKVEIRIVFAPFSFNRLMIKIP